jgi:2,4-diaminopentanoate dehydrogenase
MHLKLAQFGLGPIGLATVKLASTKPWAQIVGAIEIEPTKCGRDLGELCGIETLQGARVYSCLDDLLNHAKPDVILHTSVSKFKDAFPQIQPMIERGISVVSSCEELVFPQLREPELAARLDQLCKLRGARVVGTGVNPGFVMDLLPLCLTGVSCAVHAIHVQRVVNASTRRASLQRKIGSGMAPADFRRLLERGEAGHAGLRESLALIAHGLGWSLDGPIVETADAVVADLPIRTQYFAVETGQVCGIHQRAEGCMRGRMCLSLDLKMHLDAPDPHDAIQIEGEPPLHMRINGGVSGDQATLAALVNTAPRLVQAKPGLLLLTELPAPRIA